MHGRFSIVLIFISCWLSRGLSAEQLPVEAFSQLPEYTSIELSPNGTKLAFIENIQDPELAILSTYNMQTHERHLLVKSDNEKVKINWFKLVCRKAWLCANYAIGKVPKIWRTETAIT